MQSLPINQQSSSPNWVEAAWELVACGYKVYEILGRGAFGVVFRVKKSRKIFAAKVMTSGEASRGEIRLWPRLKHKNILTMVKSTRTEKMAIFITPLIGCTLFKLVNGNGKDKKYVSFGTIVLILKDVLKGLCYLHSNKFCHLDIKEDNVLVTEDLKKAVICDFGGLSVSNYPVSDYLLPPYKSPPEAFHPSVHKPNVNGPAFDIWSFGIMALSVWTRDYLDFQICKNSFSRPTRRSRWYRTIYPHLLYVLQPNKFTTHMKMTFREKELNSIPSALNLVKGCLREEPGDRPTAAAVLQHGFWSGTEERLPEDSIWSFDPKRSTIESMSSVLADSREVECDGRCFLCLPWALRDLHAASVLRGVCCDEGVEEDYGALVANAIKTFKDPEYIRRKRQRRLHRHFEGEKAAGACPLLSAEEQPKCAENHEVAQPEVKGKKPTLWKRFRGWIRRKFSKLKK